MSGLRTGHSQAEASLDARTEVLVRASLGLLSAYLLVTALPLLRWSLMTRAWLPLTTHAAVLGVTILCRRALLRSLWIREWMPLALVPLLYVELRWIIVGGARPRADLLISGWDSNVFGTQLSQTLAPRWHSLALSELLHLCYLSYYAIVYVPPLLLWLRGRHTAFASTVFALVTMYVICFTVFILLPVDGPRFLSGPSAAPDGPIRAVVLRILSAGSSRGTAFPSAHVAASVVAGICALRFQWRVGIVVVLLTIGMTVGAVYGGYHYAVDVIAGLLTGLASAGIAYVVERSITRRLATPR